MADDPVLLLGNQRECDVAVGAQPLDQPGLVVTAERRGDECSDRSLVGRPFVADDQTTPNASIASATFLKPPMLAPLT